MRREVIGLRDVTRRFGALTAVDEVSLSVAEGEIVGLLGHNGAGKTTLLRLLIGLLAPDGGEVRVHGLDPVVDGEQVRRVTGVLGEHQALDGYLTVRENLEVHAALHGLPVASSHEAIDGLLHRLGLWAKRDEQVRRLSAGLAQRATMARSLVHDPWLLLLDEPTTNMDPVATREVRELIVDSVRERGRTVVLSTHDLTEAERLCDRVAILRNGRLLAVGAPAELRRRLGGSDGVRVTTTPGNVDALIGAMAAGTDVVAVDDATAEIAGPITPPTVVKELVTAGVEVQCVEPLGPSFEDLYVALHRRRSA